MTIALIVIGWLTTGLVGWAIETVMDDPNDGVVYAGDVLTSMLAGPIMLLLALTYFMTVPLWRRK